MAIIDRDEQKFDIRLVDRFLKNGVVKSNDYQSYLKSLKDCSENMEVIRKEDVLEPEEDLPEDPSDL
jgi:pantothenate kinase